MRRAAPSRVSSGFSNSGRRLPISLRHRFREEAYIQDKPSGKTVHEGETKGACPKPPETNHALDARQTVHQHDGQQPRCERTHPPRVGSVVHGKPRGGVRMHVRGGNADISGRVIASVSVTGPEAYFIP